MKDHTWKKDKEIPSINEWLKEPTACMYFVF